MFSYIFPQSFMSTYAGGNTPVSRSVGTLAGKGLKILNFTNYDISVLAGTEVVDYIPAYQFLVLPNTPDLSLMLAGTASTNYTYPTPYVAVRSLPDEAPYELGSLIHFTAQAAGDTVNVAGNVDINGTPTMNLATGAVVGITGSPTFNLAPGSSVGISGTPTVTFASGAQVDLAPGAVVGISGTPTVTFAAGASVSISGTPTMNLAAGSSVNATIQNAQINSNIVNTQLATQASQGSFYSVTNFSGTTALNTQKTLIASGGYIVKLHYTVNCYNEGNGADFALYHGGTLIDTHIYNPTSAPNYPSVTMDFGIGVPNGGFTLNQMHGAAGDTYGGYAVTTTSPLGQQRTGSTV